MQGDDYMNNNPEGIQHSYMNTEFQLEHVSAPDSSVILFSYISMIREHVCKTMLVSYQHMYNGIQQNKLLHF